VNLDTWFGFVIASWLISLSPGAGAIAAMASGLRNGLRRGYWTTLGLQLGIVLQLTVVAAGLGALLAASDHAFALVKWFGVGYLCYLGLRQLRANPTGVPEGGTTSEDSARGMVLRGTLVNASNPKAIVFMLAVLPQFLDPTAPLGLQYLIMGLTMVAVDMLVMAGYTGLAAHVLRLLRRPAHLRLINRSFGILFLGAAALLANFRRTV
jgi:homoserine/homoserine lactone efflux protein